MEIQGGKFLTFLLEKEIYGLPLKKAREIIGMMEITHIPRTQKYIKGVINLRGKIIPVIDLRLKLGIEGKAYTARTSIIIIEVDTGDSQRLVGMVVDTVYEVLNLQNDEIEPAPEYNAPLEKGFLIGIGKMKDKVVMILDIERILTHDEFLSIRKEFTGAES
jgi:purine-binding chemotaxis protein CheW